MLRNVILASITAHNNAMNYLEGLAVVVTLDINYKQIKLPVKVWYIDYITMQIKNSNKTYRYVVCSNRVFYTLLIV